MNEPLAQIDKDAEEYADSKEIRMSSFHEGIKHGYKAAAILAHQEIERLKEKVSGMYAEQYGSADWIELRMKETWERACKAQYAKDVLYPNTGLSEYQP